MAAKWVHGQAQGIAADGFSNFDDLLRSSMFKAALHQKVAETVDHQVISLGDDGLNNLKLLLWGADLELLLQEYRGLLVVVAYNLVDDVLPVTVDIAIEESAIVQGFGGREVSLALRGNDLNMG